MVTVLTLPLLNFIRIIKKQKSASKVMAKLIEKINEDTQKEKL